jgi:exopolysaccharide biosynthesis protein
MNGFTDFPLGWGGRCKIFSMSPSARPVLTHKDSHPFTGVTYRQFTGTITRPAALGALGDTQPLQMHALVIDLNTPGISFGVTAPDAQGLTHKETTLNYAKRVQAQLSINANFFDKHRNPTRVEGHAAANGTVYGTDLANYYQGTISFTNTNQASLLLQGRDRNLPPTLFNAVTGNMVLINGGQIVNQTLFDKSGLFARTAMGITQDQKLVLFVVDGPAARVNGVPVSSGLTQVELAAVLLEQFDNLNYAINLDGGGSTGMVMCPTPSSCGYVNQPSLASAQIGVYQGDRPVGNNFGVFVANSQNTSVAVPPPILGILAASGLAIVYQSLSRQRHKRTQ